MTTWRRIPLRLRLTLLFVPGMALMLTAVAVFTVHRTERDLLDAVDAGLRSRAEVIAGDIRTYGPSLSAIDSELIESDEAFAQIDDQYGAVVQSSPIVVGQPLLPAATVASLAGPGTFHHKVRGIDGQTRILAVPATTAGGRWVVVVGASLQDRHDQIVALTRTLAVALPIGLLVVAAAGWALMGGTLRPVERLRAEAAALATSDLGGRLNPGPANDEIARLGGTLNALLDRAQEAVDRERRLVDNASHELRTPLSILRAELELALAHPRSTAELQAALRSASEETDHLVRLAEDLLVLSRARAGDLPVRRERVSLGALLNEIVSRHRGRAADIVVTVDSDGVNDDVLVDVHRFRQAIDNLLDNASRHASPDGSVEVHGDVHAEGARVSVTDTGPGFAPDVLTSAFEPFVRGVDGDGIGRASCRERV